MPRSLSVFLGLLGVILCFGLVLVIRTFELYTADVRDTGIAVWVHTPIVSPGDTLTMEVGLFGGSRAAIDHVVVSGEGIAEDVSGLGKHWGGVITTKTGEVGKDEQTLHVAIPREALPGKTMVLHVGATGTLAESAGYGTFSDRSATRSVDVPIEVLAPRDKPTSRFFTALRGLAALGAAFWFFRFSWQPMGRFIARADADKNGASQSLVSLAIGLAISYCLAGILYFALPLRHATGLLGDAWTAAFLLVWLVAPPYLGAKLAGPVPDPPRPARLRALSPVATGTPRGYREGVEVDRPRLAPISALFAALSKIEGARARQSGYEIEVVRRGKPRETVLLSFPDDEVGSGDITFHYDGAMLAIEVAHALASVLGPLEMTLAGVPLAIDGGASPNEMIAFWSKEVVGRMHKVLQSI